MNELERLLAQAQDLAADRRWPEAASVWMQLAERSREEGVFDGERWALDAAGEAWRRADRPREASRALRMAMLLAREAPAAASGRVKLAGAVGELGETGKAESLCREALDLVESGAERLLALDTLVSALIAQGSKEDARSAVREMAETSLPQADAAVLFREGQILRLDGVLRDSERRFAQVVARLEGRPEALAGVAAARGEQAEIAILRGEYAEAVAAFERAVVEYGESERRSLVLRAEAGRVRAMVEAGIEPIVRDLGEGIAFAQSRGLLVLEVDLRIARGLAIADSDRAMARQDLARATEVAERCGLRIRAGRALLERATRLGGPRETRMRFVERAESLLAVSAPWAARARLARSILIGASDPRVAARLAEPLVGRFEEMGMIRDRERAEDVVLRGA